MTALQNYRITASNGSENQVSFYHPELTEEENALLRRLPGVLKELDSLCPGIDEYPSYIDDVLPCSDLRFVECLFRHYRYLWRVLAVVEDHPSIDFSSFAPSFDKFPDFSSCWVDTEDGDPPVYMSFYDNFAHFLFVVLPPYRLNYYHYKLTGEIVVDPRIDIGTLPHLAELVVLA